MLPVNLSWHPILSMTGLGAGVSTVVFQIASSGRTDARIR
jgi:hypothetical protein